MLVNPFVLNAFFPYPLKTSENLTVFLCFQGIEQEFIGNEWIKKDDENNGDPLDAIKP